MENFYIVLKYCKDIVSFYRLPVDGINRPLCGKMIIRLYKIAKEHWVTTHNSSDE